MSFISYAQNFEDLVLWRALKHIDAGFYIDVGAQDPVYDSVSLGFYEKGWRGVHVEASPAYAAKLREARPDEEVVELALDREQGEITFFEIAETGLSTGDQSIAEKHISEGRQVERTALKTTTLALLLDRFQNEEIHWLKIDVEGMEQAVIEGWPPSSVKPWVVVVESTMPNSQEPSYQFWDPQLQELGYSFVYFDGLNRFYVSDEHPELLPKFGLPPNIFDDFKIAETSVFVVEGEVGAKANKALAAELSHIFDEQLAQQAALQAALQKNLEQSDLLETLSRDLGFVHPEHQELGDQSERNAALALQIGFRKERATHKEDEARLALEIAARAAAEEKLEIARHDREVAESNRSSADAARMTAQHRLLQSEETRSKLEARIVELSEKLEETDRKLRKLTAPFRFLSSRFRWLKEGTTAWAKFKPGSRPHRVVKWVIIAIGRWVSGNRRLRKIALLFLRRHPALFQKSRTFALNNGVLSTQLYAHNIQSGIPERAPSSLDPDIFGPIVSPFGNRISSERKYSLMSQAHSDEQVEKLLSKIRHEINSVGH